MRYKLSEQLSATLRGEYYRASWGVIISQAHPEAGDADFGVAGGSLNLDYAPSPQVLCRLETRALSGQNGIFRRRNGVDEGSYGNLTASVALGF
jgi:hypothetical protein